MAGSEGHTWESDDVLLTRTTSPKSTRFRDDLKRHPLRTPGEW